MVDNQQDDIVLVDTLKLGAFGGWMSKTLAARTRIGKEAHLEYLAFCSTRCFFACKVNDTESSKISLVFILNPTQRWVWTSQVAEIVELTLSESFLDKRAIELLSILLKPTGRQLQYFYDRLARYVSCRESLQSWCGISREAHQSIHCDWTKYLISRRRSTRTEWDLKDWFGSVAVIHLTNVRDDDDICFWTSLRSG